MYLHVLVRIIMCQGLSMNVHVSASGDSVMIPHVLTRI
jgi:hypothetical protein